MKRTPIRSTGLAALTFTCCASLLGCSQVLGIEDWTDPLKPSGSTGSGGSGTGSGGSGGTDMDTTSSSTSSSSGVGGGGGVGGGPCIQSVDPSCADCKKNGSETDVDCGGDSCVPCGPGKACLNDTDCANGACLDSTLCPTGRCCH